MIGALKFLFSFSVLILWDALLLEWATRGNCSLGRIAVAIIGCLALPAAVAVWLFA